MSRVFKAALIAGSVAVSAWAIRDAHAGNFNEALNRQVTAFYAVQFAPGQYADFTGIPGRVTVDDITFDVHLRPNRLVYPFVPPNAPPDPDKTTPWFTTDDIFWTTVGAPLG